MQITQTNGIGMIDKAKSDCGRIEYLPIGNDRILVDGRDAYHGNYLGGGKVEADLWAIACGLMRDVDAHNRKVLDDAREQHFAEQDANEQTIAASLKGTRGTYADPNSY